MFVRLHEIVLDTGHPGWRGAVSEIYYCGYSEFTYDHLAKIDRSKLSAQDAEHVDDYRKQMKKSLEDPKRRREIDYGQVESWIEKAAYAEHVESPLAKTLTPWVYSYFVNHPDKVLSLLRTLYTTYTPSRAVADPRGLTRRVRALAVDILMERKE